MAASPQCVSCAGTGELPTDYGVVDCPDCGGAGYLPSRAVLTDWRARDLARNLSEERPLGHQDARWLLAELRGARDALTEIIALAHDVRDDDQIALRIRMVASRAMGLYETVPVAPAPTATATATATD